MLNSKPPKAPKHLQPATKRWFNSVVTDYALDPHHIHLLTLACEARDQAQQAYESLLVTGPTYEDRFGAPRSRPEVAILRDARIAFARLVRELSLDVEESPEAPRPPGLAAARRI